MSASKRKTFTFQGKHTLTYEYLAFVKITAMNIYFKCCLCCQSEVALPGDFNTNGS